MRGWESLGQQTMSPAKGAPARSTCAANAPAPPHPAAPAEGPARGTSREGVHAADTQRPCNDGENKRRCGVLSQAAYASYFVFLLLPGMH